ncbi:LysR family transcriptional regulator [Photobacterium sp. J15]|uniref:LysR family transcriptional regulator n=1 Tax=Photobacterium sp. J15 TaxID=265901 RepID=UPI0007E47503|nr:LysR family transcriptional regulator [Photobacterium sp. J15]
MHDNISLFVAVIEAGSFKSASKQLNIPSSTIGRRIRNLEDEFSCKLLSRNSHTFEMTREGRKLYENARFHVNSLDSIANELRDDVSGDKGHIKLLAPTNLVASCIHEPLSNYLKENPKIELELELSNALTSFYSSNADMAIRVGKQEDSNLTQLKIGTIKTVLVASPVYLQSVDKLEEPKDLEKVKVIVVEPLTTWELYHNSHLSENICYKPVSRRVLINDLNVAKQFAVNGLGITLIPLTEVKDELESGKLIRVLPNWHGKNRDVYAIWYRRQLLSTRASRLIDYLKNNTIF